MDTQRSNRPSSNSNTPQPQLPQSGGLWSWVKSGARAVGSVVGLGGQAQQSSEGKPVLARDIASAVPASLGDHPQNVTTNIGWYWFSSPKAGQAITVTASGKTVSAIVADEYGGKMSAFVTETGDMYKKTDKNAFKHSARNYIRTEDLEDDASVKAILGQMRDDFVNISTNKITKVVNATVGNRTYKLTIGQSGTREIGIKTAEYIDSTGSTHKLEWFASPDGWGEKVG